MIFCHKNEKEITLGADSAQENWGSRAKVSTCQSFLELLDADPFPFLKVNILGVCSFTPEGEGLALAWKMSIHTTDNLEGLFKLKGLDSVLN